MKTLELDGSPHELSDDENDHIRPNIGQRLAWTYRMTSLLAGDGQYHSHWSDFVERGLKTHMGVFYTGRYYELDRAQRKSYIEHPDALKEFVHEYVGDIQGDLEEAFANLEHQNLIDLPLQNQRYFTPKEEGESFPSGHPPDRDREEFIKTMDKLKERKGTEGLEEMRKFIEIYMNSGLTTKELNMLKNALEVDDFSSEDLRSALLSQMKSGN